MCIIFQFSIVSCICSTARLVMHEQLAPLTWLAGAKLPEMPLLTGLGLEAWSGSQEFLIFYGRLLATHS